jgi:hypothetical protein
MENMNNNKLFRMDLSIIPADVISVIGKYLLIGNNDKYKFNKIFRKKNDNNLLKFFFGLDGDIFRYVNNYIGDHHDIECKEIYVQPLIDCINSCCNTKVKKIRVMYNPYIFFKHSPKLYLTDNFKFYDKDNKKINIIDILIRHKKFIIIRKKSNLFKINSTLKIK